MCVREREREILTSSKIKGKAIYVIDFPKPVGRRPKTSSFSRRPTIICIC